MFRTADTIPPSWRHVLPHFTSSYRTFVPDLPGYGLSTPISSTSRRTVAAAILESLASRFPGATVLLVGHDRGARTWQKFVTDASYPESDAWKAYPASVRELKVKGAMIIDIVPYNVQWSGMANRHIATGYFHWPFLATGELALDMILAYGGGKFCKVLLSKALDGTNEKAAALLQADDSFNIYAADFDKESVCRAASDDYVAGAQVDADEQKADWEAGRKIKLPLVVQCSAKNLGRGFDVQKVWGEWCEGKLKVETVGDSVSHYIAEEAPDVVARGVHELLELSK